MARVPMEDKIVKRAALNSYDEAQQRLHDEPEHAGCDIRLPFHGFHFRLGIGKNPLRPHFDPSAGRRKVLREMSQPLLSGQLYRACLLLKILIAREIASIQPYPLAAAAALKLDIAGQ